MLKKSLEVGAIYESEISLNGKEIKGNNIHRFFSKNCDNDILVTEKFLKDNKLDMYDNDIYEQIKNAMV